MKRNNPFRGLGVALVTPFKADGSIDYEALGSIVESLIAGGIDFLCVLGTTAETPCLTASEKQQVIDFVADTVAKRIPLLLGAGTNTTAGVIDYIKTADLSRVDGLLIVTPYYNKPSQEGLYQHFVAVAGSTQLPIVLYNVPGRTGVNLQAATTLRIANACDNVVAVKEASGNIIQIEDIIAGAPEGFEVLSGDDAITYELLGAGAVGVISVIGNALPSQFGDMVHAALKGDNATALPIHRSLGPLYKLLSVDGNPAGIKALLAAQGKAQKLLRLPLVPATAQTCDKINAWVADHKA